MVFSHWVNLSCFYLPLPNKMQFFPTNHDFQIFWKTPVIARLKLDTSFVFSFPATDWHHWYNTGWTCSTVVIAMISLQNHRATLQIHQLKTVTFPLRHSTMNCIGDLHQSNLGSAWQIHEVCHYSNNLILKQ